MKKTLALLASLLLLSSCVTPQGTGTQPAPGGTAEGDYSWPAYGGVKKRIAVLGFDNKVPQRWWDASWNVEQGLTEMVITELMATGRFIVVERGAIGEVMGEQDFGASGRVRQETAARTGELLGAQLLVKGAVTEFAEKESGGGAGIIVKGFGIGGKSNTGHVAMDIRLVDATTGQITQSTRAESKISSSSLGGIAFFKGVGFGGSGYKKTALGKATREAVHKAVTFIVQQMESTPWEGQVVKAEAGKVYLNGGADLNIPVGAVFTVFSKGEELVDPVSGLSLGHELTRAGAIRVTSVMEKASVAEVVEGKGFKRGDVLKMQ